jgi:hypothetical protein
VHIMGAEAITVSVPEMIEAAARHVDFYGDASPYYLELPAVSPMPLDKWTWAPLSLVMRVARGAVGPGTVHNIFLSIAKVGKERNLTGGLRLPHLLSCAQNSLSSSFVLELSTIVQIQPTVCSHGIQPFHPSLPVGS